MNDVMGKLFPNELKKCLGFLSHKNTLVPPKTLIENGISVGRVRQRKGEAIITASRAYHMGFNLSESV